MPPRCEGSDKETREGKLPPCQGEGSDYSGNMSGGAEKQEQGGSITGGDSEEVEEVKEEEGEVVEGREGEEGGEDVLVDGGNDGEGAVEGGEDGEGAEAEVKEEDEGDEENEGGDNPSEGKEEIKVFSVFYLIRLFINFSRSIWICLGD